MDMLQLYPCTYMIGMYMNGVHVPEPFAVNSNDDRQN